MTEMNYIVAGISYVLVSMLWGCTNPFIKRAQAQNMASSASSSTASPSTLPKYAVNDKKKASFMTPIYRMLTDSKSFIPYAINQSGSVLFGYILSQQPVSQAVPICNSLTFIFTAITGYFLCGEKVHNPSYLFTGIVFVLLGTYICLLV